MFQHPFSSQCQWFDRLMKQIKTTIVVISRIMGSSGLTCLHILIYLFPQWIRTVVSYCSLWFSITYQINALWCFIYVYQDGAVFQQTANICITFVQCAMDFDLYIIHHVAQIKIHIFLSGFPDLAPPWSGWPRRQLLSPETDKLYHHDSDHRFLFYCASELGSPII